MPLVALSSVVSRLISRYVNIRKIRFTRQPPDAYAYAARHNPCDPVTRCVDWLRPLE
ncbi:hypothetical protein BURKHO8Y_30103 [Burkholderia sp. 8Y]|nr:hypothetical protein BURKHO8Y_30103 [Burkholderia sp. 8Y]